MAHQNFEDDIEKLLEIAESSNEKVQFDNNEVVEYINEHNIEPGDTKVPGYIIYYHYWNQLKNKRTRLTRRIFFRYFKNHFEKKPTTDGAGYLLNPEPFDMTVGGYFKARGLLRRERNGRKKEKSKQ